MATSPNCKVFYKDRYGAPLKWACESYDPTPCERMAESLKRSGKKVVIVYQGQILTKEMIGAWKRQGR